MHIIDDLATVQLIVFRQVIGPGHVQHLYTEDARHLLFVFEVGISELFEPGEIIEDRVIDAIRTSRTYVGCGNPEVLEENRVIRSAAQIADLYVVFYLRGRWPHLRAPEIGRDIFHSFALARVFPDLVDSTSARTRYLLGDVAHKLFEIGNRARAEIGTGDAHIHIEVGYRALQFRRVLLTPFGRADHAFFLAIPAAEDDRPPGLPTRSQ